LTALLNQVLGVRKGVNSTVGKRFTEIHRDSMKVQLVNGLSRVYEPKDDEGEALPSEFQKVQIKVDDLNEELAKILARQWDVNATVDMANTFARGDIVIPNGPTIADVPVTTLMYLEKQLTELAAYITKLPALDPSVDWETDENTGLFRSETVKTHRTIKVTKPIVLYQATDKHAAQTQLISEDQIAGYWNTTRLSGALPAEYIKSALERVNTVKEAVVKAREKANTTPVEDISIGQKILEFIF
jgi:hypothetical protein